MSVPLANATAGLSGWFQRVANGRINPTNAKKPPSLVYGVDDHLRQNADRIRSERKDDQAVVHFLFDH